MPSRPPPELEQTHQVWCVGRVRLAVHRGWLDALPVDELLAGAPIRHWGRPLPHDLRGRGAIEVLSTPAGELVAKRLCRGGLLAALTPDLFADPWRPAREACLAEALRQRGCATPTVVVARAVRTRGGWFRLEVASARLAGALDLLAVLQKGGERLALSARVGRTLRRLHDAGLRHRDLQLKNLLLPPGEAEADLAWVLDLDRCSLGRSLAGPERVRSVARFGRSLAKRGLLPGSGARPAGAVSWRAVRCFFEGYGSLDGCSRAGFARAVAVSLARQIRLHRWKWKGMERPGGEADPDAGRG